VAEERFTGPVSRRPAAYAGRGGDIVVYDPLMYNALHDSFAGGAAQLQGLPGMERSAEGSYSRGLLGPVSDVATMRFGPFIHSAGALAKIFKQFTGAGRTGGMSAGLPPAALGSAQRFQGGAARAEQGIGKIRKLIEESERYLPKRNPNAK
jgi:hypothetical protein